MDKGTLKKNLGSFIYCSSLLEDRVARACEHAAKLISNKLISCFFRYIAHDSLKHAECFRAMAEMLSGNINICLDECVKVYGEAWLFLIKDAEKILSRSEISVNDLYTLIQGLESIESFAAEEYLTVLHVKLIELIADEEKDFVHYKTILEWIIKEEEEHKQILKIIEGLLTQS